jgi:LmbE family N-acetylglucosaminyl deacetylase
LLAAREEVIVDDGPGSARRLLGLFAHPDDEVFCAGGTMARAAEAGAEVMIVSATRGERGQIRDATAATRRTLGAVREGELGAAAAELGVQRVQVLAYPDGSLQQHRSSLGAAIADIMRQFNPDTVITFGADGGYGHPDHVAICELTTQAFGAHARGHNQGQRLYHAVFPPRRTSMAEELARWIVESGRRVTDRAALQAIALFAGESATMRLARDDVRVQWFPPGIYVIEQGEPAYALYLILNGTADALLEHPDGQVIHLRRMHAGDFFGELGLVAGERTAHVVARESLTCLVLSRMPVRPYAGRGVGATSAAELPADAAPPGTCAVDVTSYLHRKLEALARHRTQYPIVPSMLPQSLLQTMLGTEFFCRTADGSENAAASRAAKVTRPK